MTRYCTLALALAVLTACSAGYDVVIRFEPPALADEVQRVEVWLLPDCDGYVRGETPSDIVAEQLFVRGIEATGLGEVEPGTYGLAALGSSASCARTAAAECTTVTLDRTGEGELQVVLTAFDSGEIGCVCSPTGRCMTNMDAGVDAGDDAGDDAAVPDDGDTDAGSDAGCSCGSCASCLGGTCIGDHAMCGAGELCDPTVGCTAGTCAMDSDCVDDGDPCSLERCDTAGGTCIIAAATPGMACTVGGTAGTCLDDSCCTGCVDGTVCRNGDEVAACGADGAACLACACPTNACVGAVCESPLRITAIEAGGSHACAIEAGGELRCWGDKTYGATGTGLGGNEVTPVVIGVAGPWLSFGAGVSHACAVRTDGALHCWGRNDFGQLGLGSVDESLNTGTPTMVGTDTSWVRVHGDVGNHTCGLRGTQILCWGDNAGGQLGLGTPGAPMPTPAVLAGASFTDIVSGGTHTCGVNAGPLFCWGENRRGELGQGDTIDLPSPTAVGTFTDWTAVDCGDEYCCGLRGNAMHCWGENADGQYGDGSTGDSRTPTPGAAGTWRIVETGYRHTCAIASDGRVSCWGENTNGELGRGSTSGNESDPLVVGSRTDWVDLALGDGFSCALAADGTVWCTGRNDTGQLGAGDTVRRLDLTPVCF